MTKRCFNCKRRGLQQVGKGLPPDKCWFGLAVDGKRWSVILPEKRFLVRICWHCWRSDSRWLIAARRLEELHKRKISEGPLV